MYRVLGLTGQLLDKLIFTIITKFYKCDAEQYELQNKIILLFINLNNLPKYFHVA